MKSNKEILREAFFKKMSYEEKRHREMPQYSPVDLKKSSKFAPNTVLPMDAFQVTDTDEVKRRLAGAYGVAFGNNNVRSMASRAIKEFPIIVSDNIEPETTIMIKKMVEEQYAEYINLLISNQVVNLADYSANDEEGNIAIQALDSISGTDFRRSRVADKAAKSNSIDADTVFQNIPLYNLLRENQMELKTGDAILDTLLENAVVIPSENTQSLVDFFDNNIDEIAILKENDDDDYEPTARNNTGENGSNNNDKKRTTLSRYLSADDIGKEKEDERDINKITKSALAHDMRSDMARGFMGIDADGNEIYRKLSTADVVIDPTRFDQAVNRSVGEMLTDSANIQIRDKFEKATFLLQSRRISGLEYYQYLTLRLGIPVSDTARKELLSRFKIADIRKYGKGYYDPKDGNDSRKGYLISKAEIKAIAENRRPTEKIIRDIKKTRFKEFLGGVGVMGGSAVIGAILSTVFAPAFVLSLVGGSAFLIGRAIFKHKENKKIKQSEKIQGWERVESLIIEMDRQQEELRNPRKYEEDNSVIVNKDMFGQKNILSRQVSDLVADNKKFNKEYEESSFDKDFNSAVDTLHDTKKDYIKAIEDNRKMIKAALAESVEDSIYSPEFKYFISECVSVEDTDKIFRELAEEYENDEYLKAEILEEKVLAKTTTPMTVKYVETKDKKDLLLTPSFMARDTYAYGSVELDKKYLKDRRYNQPLIMTVKFKERFDDGKYSDNELTAVIGILGKIIRVPSSEMEYVLKESISGNTIEGIFTGSLDDKIEDLFDKSKISNELKNLPQSADIWRNLEKVTTLAVANKISGKRSGNISNAHIVFSQKEVDAVRTDTGIDFVKDVKKATALMRRYSAFTLMVANDVGQRMAILNDRDSISWDLVPYSALMSKESGDQINAALTKMMRLS